jgi:hypothetical protein
MSIIFMGNITGLTVNDKLDLGDIYPATVQAPVYTGTTMGGTLKVTDGTHTANFALLGNYLASSWTTSSDSHGGTFVVDPPNGNQQALLTTSHHHQGW